jgi:hypothetical protein
VATGGDCNDANLNVNPSRFDICDGVDNNCNGQPDDAANACAPWPNATNICFAGACEISACDSGFANCDFNLPNGCEANLRTNVTHCGACNNTCVVANGFPVCNNATCQVLGCAAGFSDCNGFAVDGCERNLSSDVFNCGACNHACGAGQFCSNGTCGGAVENEWKRWQ